MVPTMENANSHVMYEPSVTHLFDGLESFEDPCNKNNTANLVRPFEPAISFDFMNYSNARSFSL